MKLRKRGFTLVELIVVITILAILGTIWFISFNGLISQARDTTRTQDLENLKKTLSFYYSSHGSYPLPTNPTNITYSWADLWMQGTVGDSVVRTLWTINKKPIDPIFQTEYTYSVTAWKNEFEVSWIVENSIPVKVSYFPLVEQTYANTELPFAYIVWSYNQRFVVSKGGSLDYIIATPSITLNSTWVTDFPTISNNKSILFSSYAGAPSSYSWVTSTKNGFTYLNGSWSFEVFSGSLTVELKSGVKVHELASNLLNAYSWSIINPYSDDVGAQKAEIIKYTWNVLSQVVGLPKINLSKSCKEILWKWESRWDGYYTVFTENEDSLYTTYCDMSNGWWDMLFSVDPAGTKWAFNSIQWMTPTYNNDFWVWNYSDEELTSYAYWNLKTNEIRICRGGLTNCYVMSHGQNRTLKSFFNSGESYVDFSRCYPNATYCNAWDLPNSVWDDSHRSQFLSLFGVSSDYISSRPRQWMGININYKNKIWFQADHNNVWPDFDNGGAGIGLFRSRNCWYDSSNSLIDNARARSVWLPDRCAYQTPDTQKWYIFGR